MFGVLADGVVTIFKTEVVGFAIQIRTTTVQIFPTTHLSPIHSIYKFAMGVDLHMIFVCVMLQKLNPHSPMSKIRTHHFKMHRFHNKTVVSIVEAHTLAPIVK